MACAGCGQKYPGSYNKRVTTTTTHVQPKVPVGGRYVVKTVVPPPVSQGAFPIGTKK